MDRNYIIGLILIAALFIAWFVYVGNNPPPPQPPSAGDTLAVRADSTPGGPADEYPEEQRSGAGALSSTVDSLAAVTDSLPVDTIAVETQLYSAKLSTLGGGLISFVLKDFEYLDNGGIEMIQAGGLAVPNFRFNQGRLSLQQLRFQVDKNNYVKLTGQDSSTLAFSYAYPTGETIVKRYRFFADRYAVDISLEIDGVVSLGFADYYEFFFEPGLEPTERNVKDDLDNFKAYALMGGSVEKFDDFNDRDRIQEDLNGATDWISTRSKYFTAAMIPTLRDAAGITVSGSRGKHDESRGITGYSHVGISLKMPVAQRDQLFDTYTVYLGPLQYDRLEELGQDLENTLDLGWSVIRPFSKFITRLMILMHNVIPNYGVVIVLFAVIVKLVFAPLSYKAMKSMRRMQEIMPKQNAIREKYKNDPQRMQQEIMKLYRSEKINPMSGCLPMLPQIPIFWALFTVFRYTIELRGQPFVWWMQDLSQPDPIYILPVLMAVSMFVQQKMTVKDPKQKLMIYLFPGLFLFWGLSFPAGLCLYWSMTNILSLFEAIFVHKRHLATTPEPVTDVQNNKEPKKK